MSNRFRNHIRRCANDNGNRSGRARAAGTGRAPTPTSALTRSANAATDDASNTARTGTVASSARPNRAATRVELVFATGSGAAPDQSGDGPGVTTYDGSTLTVNDFQDIHGIPQE